MIALINKILRPFKMGYCKTWMVGIAIFTSISIARWIYYNVDITLHNFKDRAIGIAILNGIDAAHRTTAYVEIIMAFIMTCFIVMLLLTWSKYLLDKSRTAIHLEEKMMWLGSIGGSFVLILWNSKLGEAYNKYFHWIAFGFYVFLGILLVLWLIKAIFNKYGSDIKVSNNNKMNAASPKIKCKTNRGTIIEEYYLMILSATIIGLMIVYKVFRLSSYREPLVIISCIAGAMTLWWVAKRYFHKQLIALLPIANSYHLLLGTFAPAAFITFLPMIIIKQAITLSPFVGLSLVIAWISVLTVLSLAFSRSQVSLGDFEKKWIWVMVPLAVLLLAMPLINETQYTLTRLKAVSPRALAVLLSLGLLIWTVWRYFLSRGLKTIPSPKKVIENIYFPLLIATLLAFQNYSHYLTIAAFDMFHDGESLIGAHQYMLFGRLPFVDIWLTHGLSDTYYQYLYMLINGYKMLEPLMWKWVNIAAGFVIVYYFLKQWIKAPIALMLVLLLPVGSIANQYYHLLLLPPLILKWAVKRNDYKGFILAWLMVMGMFLWRIDFGLAVFVAYGFYFAITYTGDALLENKWPWKSINVNILGLVCGLGLFIGLWLIAVSIRHQSAIEIIKEVLLYIKIQAPTMAFSWITDKDQANLPLLQYVLLPGISIAIVCYFIYKHIFRGVKTDGLFTMLLFLAVVSMVISIRTVQRHCLGIVGYNPILFVLCGILLMIWNKKPKLNWTIILLGVVLLHAAVFKDKTGMYFNNQITWQIKTNVFSLHFWEKNNSRLKVNDNQYREVVAFLRENLRNGQTIFDLSNTPMIYVTAEKELLSFIIPPHYHATESVQGIELNKIIAAHDKDKVPFIIMRSPNTIGNWNWNNVDHVPNEMRSYRVVEYIYKHYEPCVEIDGYQIWKDKQSVASNIVYTLRAQKAHSIQQKYDLMKLPWIWAQYDPKEALKKTSIQQKIISGPVTLSKGVEKTLSIGSSVSKENGNYLHMKIRAEESGQIIIKYGMRPSTIEFEFQPAKDARDYLVRISSQWEWMTENINQISLVANNNIVVDIFDIRAGD